jgi:adenylate cyclase
VPQSANPPASGTTPTTPTTGPAQAAANATPTPTDNAALPTAPAPSPPESAPQPRLYSPNDVPFVPEFRRRMLENYAQAEAAKAMAINARGIVATATRRIDAAVARRAALEECDRMVQREIANMREFDRCMLYAVGNDVVWTYRMPPVPPFPYMPAKRPSPPILLDPATVPLIAEPARQNLSNRYMKAERKRALVLGRKHSEWWLFGPSEEDAVRRALQLCGHVTGRLCAVYAIEDQVVVRVPERNRILDILIPSDVPNLDARQREAIEKYLVADDWRAIAAGRNGRIGVASGRASENAAIDDAMRECGRAGGTECAILAEGPFLVTAK